MSSYTAHCSNNCATGLAAHHGDSTMAEVRIFSYLPNPRVWKAVIAARIGGVALEVRGAAGAEVELNSAVNKSRES
jgi:hypothetical protein